MTAAGRAASVEKLIEQLEHFYQKPTGLTRPITFGPNRRFGTGGAYIVGDRPEASQACARERLHRASIALKRRVR